MTSLNITTAKIIENAFYAMPSSIEKASMIDYPALLIFAPEYAISNSIIAGISYEIRTTINNSGNKAFNIEEDNVSAKVMLAAASGGIGGAFKYYAVRQNPLIGAISTTVYEICGAFKFCAYNPLVYGPVTIVIESLDAAAHVSLRTSEGDIYGAIIQGAIGGAKIGATVYGLIQSIYVPGTEVLHKAEDIALNSVSDYFVNLIYAGDIDNHSEL